MRCASVSRIAFSLRPLGHPSVPPARVPAAAASHPSRPSASMETGHSVCPDEYSSIWERKFWGKDGGLKPGEAFDGSQASPALAHALASGDVSVAGKRVLVPGCGRGYDVVEFARSGAQYTAGLELVPQAQQEAANYVAGQLSEEGGARAQVFVGDFFKWQHESVPSWDVGYDYTFMCALHPTMRPDWAAAWARYLAQPGSQLVCLAFPLNSDSETGPPWAVTVQQYKDLLRPHGFVCEREEPVPPERSHAGRGGRECMLVFSRQ